MARSETGNLAHKFASDELFEGPRSDVATRSLDSRRKTWEPIRLVSDRHIVRQKTARGKTAITTWSRFPKKHATPCRFVRAGRLRRAYNTWGSRALG